ncbi:uncharacterized protein [Linepithema humile]|uniref:uncharacterized protein n=1 Tax=Linepithema humile TaxID=83485 RepID=UPI000623B0FE|nr:PREDICTED: uncharacterized protein LOC105672994 [Linepithema humile]
MLTHSKAILRPKVRFSESSNNMPNEESVQHFEEKAVLQVKGPTVKSIEILKKPVRVIYPKQQAHNKDTLVSKTEILTHFNDAASENIHNTSPSNKNLTNVNISKILCNSNNTQKIGKNYKELPLDKSSQNNVVKDYKKDLRQMGKENKNTVLKKTVLNKNKSKKETGNIQMVVQKTNTVDVKSSKTQSASRIMKKRNQTTKTGTLNVKPVMYNAMPYKKTIKKPAVKKTVLRNVSDRKVKTSVEPGISRKRQDNTSADNANEKYIVAKGVNVERLAQPEYNSIMCTINKLKELEQQRIVTDIDHLSSAQKSLITGKISTALDFPLDEAIYKNLVDLSVDEKQLPSTVMRSKDPEPRQRDITPKLSDFFIPEDAKEICEAVQVKPRILKNENMNFLKICDKIFEMWKFDSYDIE